jgi:sugar phosphate isomerase/epimerase
MFEFAISEMTTSRWDLTVEVERYLAHGFEAISVWRPKVTDHGAEPAAALIAGRGLRVSSVRWAGGFTGGDGRSFEESVEDAGEVIEMAETLGAPVVVVHSGCRGGHTRSHARRLLSQAVEALLPQAARAGVALAVKPMHPAASDGCSFVNRLSEAVELVEGFNDQAVRLALDLWHWADDPELVPLVPRLAELVAVVQVADRRGPPAASEDRLPVGHGELPLVDTLDVLWAHGCAADVELDPVGETVELMGYEGVLAESRRLAAAWAEREVGLTGPAIRPPHRQAGHFRGGASRRSQASSQIVSPG